MVLAAAAVGVYSLVDVDATESKTENRHLAGPPEFSLSALLDGSYISDLETYYADTFPGRDMLLSANKALNGFYHFSGGGDSNKLVVDFSGGMEQGGQALNPDHATDAQDPPAEPETPEERRSPIRSPWTGRPSSPETPTSRKSRSSPRSPMR